MTKNVLKKNLLAGISLVALAAACPAHAQPPTMPSWAGWYVGGNFGYSLGNNNFTYTDPGFGFGGSGAATTFSGHQRLDGIIGGGQVGYNWMLNSAVVGLEADFQGANEKASQSYSTNCEGPNSDTGTCNLTQKTQLDWFGTVRGRFGWLATPTIMPYVTAGLAYGQLKVSGTANVTSPACTTGCSWSWSDSKVNVGFAGGFGVEAFFPGSTNWTWKAEYLYINLGSVSGSGLDPVYGTTYSWKDSFTDNIVRGGINYYFH